MSPRRVLPHAPWLLVTLAASCRSTPQIEGSPRTEAASAAPASGGPSALPYPIAEAASDARDPLTFSCVQGKLTEGIGLGGITHDSVSWPDGPQDASRTALARALCPHEEQLDACVRGAIPDGGKLGSVSFLIDVRPGQVTTEGAPDGGTTADLTRCVSDALAKVSFPMNGRFVYRNNADAPHGRFGRRAPGLHFKLSTTQTGKALPPEVVERILRQRAGAFRACYTPAIAAHPGLEGTVAVSFDVDVSGKVQGARLDPGTIGDEAMRSCVKSAIAGLAFPQPEPGKLRVSATFVFESE